MDLFADRSHELRFTVVLIAPSSQIRDGIAQALSGSGVKVLHEPDAQNGIATARACGVPVVLVTTDVNWRQIVIELDRDEMRPSVIVVLSGTDSRLWAEALNAGAFDACTVSGDRKRFLWTLASAYRRWERKQLVRAALLDNPLGHAS